MQQSLQTVLKQTLKHHELQGLDEKMESLMLDGVTDVEAKFKFADKTMFMKLPLSL